MTLFAINIRRLLVTCLLFLGVTLASVYEEGETVSVEHQNVIFEQCFGYDQDGEVKLFCCEYSKCVRDGSYRVY